MATDQELNEYVSVKRYAPYRQDKGDRYRWNKKDQEKLHELKSKIQNRSGIRSTAGGQALSDGGEKARKRKGRKERLKAAKAGALEQPEEILEVSTNDTDTTSMGKRKREGDQGIVQTEPEPQQKKKRKKEKNEVAVQA